MYSKKYNVALIGCGAMGAAHLDDICEKDNVILRCVCDTDIDHARSFAEKYHALSYETDYKKVAAIENVDIVIISAYPSVHFDMIEECFLHGKHVCAKSLLLRI